MSDPTLWKIWRCRKKVHPQPCWHGRCRCGVATAFDFSYDEAFGYLERHHCELIPVPKDERKSER